MREYEAKVLKKVIQGVLLAAGKDAARPQLRGVHFSYAETGDLRVCATDGHRLHIVQCGGVFDAKVPDVGAKALVSVADAKRLAAALPKAGAVAVLVEPEGVTIGDLTVPAVQDVTFPPYHRVSAAPESHPAREIGFNLEYLEQAAKFVRTLAPKTSSGHMGRLMMHGELDPQHIQAWNEDTQVCALAVVMPCRIN